MKRFGLNLLIVALVIFMLSGDIFYQDIDSGVEGRALIVDALAADMPNPSFIESAVNSLESGGFDVDLLMGGNVTIQSLKSIEAGYDVVVFRVHSEAFKNQVFLFTAEPYSDYKHLTEQMRFEVTGANPGWRGEPVFAVGLNFLRRYWADKFNNSLVIVMGCRGFYTGSEITGQEGLGASYLTTEWFIEEGASAYIGWDGLVDLDYTDRGTSLLLDLLFREGRELSYAVERVTDEIGLDPHGSKLCYVTSEN